MSTELSLTKTQQAVFGCEAEWAKSYGRSLARRAGIDPAIAENAALVGLVKGIRESDNIRCVSKLKIFGEVMSTAQREGWLNDRRLSRLKREGKGDPFIPYEPHKDRRTCNSKSPLDECLLREDIAALPRLIAELPAHLRTVIERRYFGENTSEEIAADLGVTVRCVDNYHQRALEMMRGAA